MIDRRAQGAQRGLITVATREENIKKINEQLEQMSDEELEKVAGGILVRQMPNSDTEKISKPDNDSTRFYARM